MGITLKKIHDISIFTGEQIPKRRQCVQVMQPTVNALNFTQITQPDQVRGDENLLIVAYLVGDILVIMIPID